jgi:transcriptional regulator with XRE-family HTH domain
MSAVEFYTRSEIGRSRYSAVFKSDAGPRLETIERLANALGVQMFELLLPEVYEFDDLPGVIGEVKQDE